MILLTKSAIVILIISHYNLIIIPWMMVISYYYAIIIELDDGEISTGKPDKFDVKTHGFPVKIFPWKSIQLHYLMPYSTIRL